MDEVVALGLILELQQKGAESVDLITGELTKLDQMLATVDTSITAVDSRVTSMDAVFGSLAPTLGTATAGLEQVTASALELDRAAAVLGPTLGEVTAAAQTETEALTVASGAAQQYTVTTSQLVSVIEIAQGALASLAAIETVEGDAAITAAAGNQKLALSKEEIAAAAETAKAGLVDLTAAESLEGEESQVVAAANQKLALSKEEIAAAAEVAKADLLDLAGAEGTEGEAANVAAGANSKLAAAKGQVATDAELAAQAERQLAELELMEAYAAEVDAGATSALYMSKTQLINASRVQIATEADVAEAELLAAMEAQVAADALLMEGRAAAADAAYLELLAAMEIELASTTGALTAETNAATVSMARMGGTIDATAASSGIISFFGNVKGVLVDVAEALGIVAIAGGVLDVAAVKWASDFQDAIIKVEALSGVSHQQVQQYSEEILALSQNTSVSAKNMGDALYFISTGAYKGSAAMEVLDVSQKAAAAGLGQTKVVADAVTSALTAYHQTTSEAAHVTDVLIQGVIEGKAEADSFAGAMGRFLPIMAAAGISLEEGTASMAAMTRVGLSAEESATALRQSINNLVAPTNQARKEMEALGLSTDDVRKMIAEKGLLGTYQKLIELTHGDMDAIRELIPNIRAMTGVLAELGPTGDAYTEILANIRGSVGATDKAFEVAQGAISFQISRMINDIKSIGIEIGDELIPLLNPKIHALGDWFIEQSRAVKTFNASVKGLVDDNGLDTFSATLAVTGRSIGENFGPDAEQKFERITQVIGDMAEGTGTAVEKMVGFFTDELMPVPDRLAAIFSTDGGMVPVLDALENAVTELKLKLISWVDPAKADLLENGLPRLKTELGDWFANEAPALEQRITGVWVPAATKWAVDSATDVLTDKLPKFLDDVGTWAGETGVPVFLKVGTDLAGGITDGLTQGLVEAVPKILDKFLLEPARNLVKDISNLELLVKEGVRTGDWAGLAGGTTVPSDPRYVDPIKARTGGSVGGSFGESSFFDNQNQMDATEHWADATVDLIEDTTEAIIDATAEVERARSDMNTSAPTGNSATARELAAAEAARKKAAAEADRQRKFAEAHDPLAGLMEGLRDNKQNYIDEYGKLGGALASALDESLYSGTTAAGKKVATAIEAQVGALRTAEIPEWRALGDELADAIYGSMADPHNIEKLQAAQAEIAKINDLLEAAAQAKQEAKFWDEWAKGGEEAANKINVAMETANEKITAAHEKAATAAQAAWDKLNLTRELDAAHQKVEGLMKDYETIRNSAKIDQARGREDTSTEQTRENQIADIQLKRGNEVTDAEQAHERALADLRLAHVQKLAEIRRDTHNKNMAIDIAKENTKFNQDMANLQTKWERENTDRTNKWGREDSARATSWQRDDARRATQRAQQDADRANEYAEADRLKDYKLSLEQQFGIDKESLRQKDFDDQITKINQTEQTAIQAALSDVDKITAAAETKLDQLWDKLLVKYKGLFKSVTGQESEGGPDDETSAVGSPGTDYGSMVGNNGDTGTYTTRASAVSEAEGKIIRSFSEEEDTVDGLSDSIEGMQTVRDGAVTAGIASMERENLARGVIAGETITRDAALTVSANGAASSIGAMADAGEIAARNFLEMRGPIKEAGAALDSYAASANNAAAANANLTGTLGNQGGGRDGTGGDAHDMSSMPFKLMPGTYFPSWAGTAMGGNNPTTPINAGGIPKAAEGGVVSEPTVIEVAEGGEPEAIAPLSTLPSLMGQMYPKTQILDLGFLSRSIAEALKSAPLVAVLDANGATEIMAPRLWQAQRDGRANFKS